MKRCFYDVETTNEFPQYCELTLIGVLVEITDDSGLTKLRDTIHGWEKPFTEEKINEARTILCADYDERVGFNNLNFDDLVLYNNDIEISEQNTHDAHLAIKTCYPGLPSFALKFLAWHLLGDPHWKQFELEQSGHKWTGEVTPEHRAYHRHDLEQHRMIWDFVKDKVRTSQHWDAYQLDMGMKLPLQEMIFDGGIQVDVPKCQETLTTLQKKKTILQQETLRLTEGKIKNINSNKQVANWLSNVEDWALDQTATGEFQLKKKDLLEIIGFEDEEKARAWQVGQPCAISPVAMLAWQMRDNETLRKYVTNYNKAALGTNMDGWIPSSYSISRASTRRTLSKSFFKINFQNSTEDIEKFKIIPEGYLGWGIDSSQIENVVHIYESCDWSRREAYEKDVDWNEYVWLCNRILGTNKDKIELDSIKSSQVPHQSVYKVFKTAKLSLNFGQGATAFSKKLNLDIKKGRAIFNDIHQACPAIRELQNGVEHEIITKGYVQDTFGHIYTGYEEEAYKIVAYLIQGCGTGSLPKAQLRANYDTLHKWSTDMDTNVGPLVSTTHDENTGLLRLDLGEEVITLILQEMMLNMTTKFEPKFDGIPLRAKLYLTTTNWYDRKNHEQKNWKQYIEIP